MKQIHVWAARVSALVGIVVMAACGTGSSDSSSDAREQDPASPVSRIATAPSSLDGSAGDDGSGGDDGLIDGPDDEYRPAPGGIRAHRSCFHSVPDGSKIEHATGKVYVDGKLVKQLPRCPYKNHRAGGLPPDLNTHPSWQEWSGAVARSDVFCSGSHLAAQWFDSTYGELTVPSLPYRNDGQTVFIWNGLENYGSNVVFQSVLQYGHADGACYGSEDGNWYFASWIVGSPYGPLCGGLHPISVGAIMHGNTYIQNQNCTMNGYNCDFGTFTWSASNQSDMTSLTYYPAPWVFTLAFRGVVEVYSELEEGVAPYRQLTGCNDLPSNGMFLRSWASWANTDTWQPCNSPADSFLVNPNWPPGDQSPGNNITISCPWHVTDNGQFNVTLQY